MSQYWLRDETGGVVGPVSLTVVHDLQAAGHFGEKLQISNDGQTFRSISDLPEVARVLAPPAPPVRDFEETQRAKQILRDLERYQTLTVSELFSVPADGSLDDYQRGFQELAKQYHPARLRKDAHPELIDASRKVFAFLNDRKRQAEQELAQGTPKQAAPAPRSPKPVATPPKAASPSKRAPRFEVAETQGGRPQLTVRLPQADLSPLTVHRLANFSMSSLFLETESPLPNGTRVEMLLRFDNPPREISSRGIVILENVIPAPTQPVGMGIRLDDLSPADRSFVQGCIKSLEKPQA